jgi:hypothetical protein
VLQMSFDDIMEISLGVIQGSQFFKPIQSQNNTITVINQIAEDKDTCTPCFQGFMQ